ncbi:MAG: hypothetical protein BGO43_08660 [Gammaproteobacteria bacterium 39-13]|nr:macro domain-containing protein [Gammaproteobacteria bacterium]OJV94315.1 MAG: hypothetical protein BGO43_08660 [Gammaproteobacteria bacterium 39-13]
MKPALLDLIKQQQNTYQTVFLKYPNHFHQPTFHYDWWMFPLKAPKTGVTETTLRYSVDENDMLTLLQDKRFTQTYLESIKKYLANLAMHGWNNYPIRFAKMLLSLDQFLKVSQTALKANQIPGIKEINQELISLAKNAVDYATVINSPHSLLNTGFTSLKRTLSSQNNVVAKPAIPVRPMVKQNDNFTTAKPLNSSDLSVDFEHSILDIDADVYVNAASINPLSPTQWGGIAGAIYNKLLASDQSVLQNHWNQIGQRVTAGKALFSENVGKAHQFSFSNGKNGLLIHAGSPMWNNDPRAHAMVKSQLTSAYLSILEKCHEYNKTANRKISKIAVPPLGVGIYGIPAEVSAQCAVDAFKRFEQTNEGANLKMVFGLYQGLNKGSADYTFGQTILASQKTAQTPAAKNLKVAEPVKMTPKQQNLDKRRRPFRQGTNPQQGKENNRSNGNRIANTPNGLLWNFATAGKPIDHPKPVIKRGRNRKVSP